MAYFFHLLIMVDIYILLILGINMLVGYTNILTLCHAAFYGIGAYFSVYAIKVCHMPIIPSMILVCGGTALVSLLISLPALRLKGDYFILITLAFMILTYSIMHNCIFLTNGPYGISGIPRPKLLGFIQIQSITSYALFSTVFTIFAIGLFKLLIYSPFGRILRGIRDDEILIESFGRNVFFYKAYAIAISASFSAVAGFLYAMYMTYIDPTSFTLDESIFILSAAIIGGTGNIIGSIAGALFVILVPELIRFINIPDSVGPNVKQIIYGVLLIIFMYFRPKGMLGKHEFKV